MKRVVLCTIVGLAIATAIAAASRETPSPPPLLELVTMNEGGVTLRLSPPTGKAGMLEAVLCELEGKELARATRKHNGQPSDVRLAATLDVSNPASYFLRYRFDTSEPYRQKSLFFLTQLLETVVIGQREYLAGTRPRLRIVVRDRAASLPVQGAKVSWALADEQGEELSRGEAVTNPYGEAVAVCELPDREARLSLNLSVATETSTDMIEESLRVVSGVRTMLTTDKPMYQPGQTVHIRALSLARPWMTPLAETDAVFEVEDSKGNKVFKHAVQTDTFGVSHADFVLADELNQGTYRIRHLAAGASEEKTVTVEKYVLPKFKIAFSSDRTFYQPGDTVNGELKVDYFFGKPVAGARVRITCSTFDVEFRDFQTIDGTTDEAGHFAFESRLPTSFVGQPLEAGKASAKFDVAVIDTADHKESVTRTLSVTADPIVLVAVPEAGELIDGLENRVYLVATYADSSPADCRITWENAPDGGAEIVETDEGGFAELRVNPREGQPLTLQLAARDQKGNTGQAEIELHPRTVAGDDRVLLHTDRTLYRVGDELDLNVRSTRKTGALYVDVIKDRQTWLTRTLTLQDGAAADRIALDASLSGTVEISAYLIGANGVIVRDRRLVMIDPANDLSVLIAAGAESYLPGSEATVTFRVTDAAGRGVPSALGVMVVDEAVFALQEMQPGLEKVYFYLEREIATPRYEIHGCTIDQVMPVHGQEPAEGARREKAARVLLAAAEGSGEYGLNINTYERDNKGAAFQNRMADLLADRSDPIGRAMAAHGRKLKEQMKDSSKTDVTLEDLVTAGELKRKEIEDPWGKPMKITGTWCASCRTYHDFTLSSAGIDGEWDTADDILYSPQRDVRRFKALGRGGFNELRMAEDVAVGAMPMAAVMPMMAQEMPVDATAALGAPGGAAPRVREYFPETLYFNPALITDAAGAASLTIPIADSITTWRMTCMASSLRGALGSAAQGLRVFQDFFVDVDFPVSLTQHDEVWVPVAVYNYLKTEQQVRLKAEPADWFEFKGESEQVVTLAPSQVKAVYFPIVVKGIGNRKFTVYGYGANRSDAVSRGVEILPDGQEQLVTFSGRLEGAIAHTIGIPADAIPDASKIFLKIFPGVLAQVVEGLDGMLRMPSGCFEQTSSVTYPNILILDYMRATKKITPELQMKAEGFINTGYQRLLSYEVDGGGFEWFGNAPAHRILTAYGLMEFFDMSKVHEVDPAVISRTQTWLAGCQGADGSYKPSEGGIREGAINHFTDDVLRNTAYITWALAHTGYQGPELEKGLRYLREHLADVQDMFTLALTANALVSAAPDDAATKDTLRKLLDRRTEEGDLVYWKADSETATHGSGVSADIEVTGLVVQAFVRAGREPGTVGKAVSFLASKKDAFGSWQSTQATIQALRAMLMAEREATQTASARIPVAIHGETVKTLTVDESNSDVMQFLDLKEQTRSGDNRIEIGFEGEGSLMYQVVGRYHVPRITREPGHESDPLGITVAYDRTSLVTDDILTVNVSAVYNRPGRAKMVILDLGLPPGFTLIPDRLNRLVEDRAIQKYSVTGRQIIVYLDEMESGKTVPITYQLLAKYPLKAKSAPSAVYEYYDPSSRGTAPPVELEVTQTP